MQTLDDFRKLIQTTQMSHIYKPVMLQAVLKRGGAATREEIAADIVSRDVLQHEHYRRNVIDRQPGNRLVRDGALVKDGDVYRLAPPFDQLKKSERMNWSKALRNARSPIGSISTVSLTSTSRPTNTNCPRVTDGPTPRISG